MHKYGLIGRKLTHSFSKGYFTDKFQRENLSDHEYELYPLENIEQIETLLESNPDLKGLNVTIPYKTEVIPYLDKLEESAAVIGAVNVIKKQGSQLIGYNSDYYGFKLSLEEWLPINHSFKALILGTGGASKAVAAALNSLHIPFSFVSRNGKDHLSYDSLAENLSIIEGHQLIINTTPLGMHPHVTEAPAIPYKLLNESYYLYDLVYNPECTQFLENGKAQGAHIKNGLEMLHLQAEKAWEIWNSEEL